MSSKNTLGRHSSSLDTSYNKLAPIRVAPLSYARICSDVTPRAARSSSSLIPAEILRNLTRLPTWTSTGLCSPFDTLRLSKMMSVICGAYFCGEREGVDLNVSIASFGRGVIQMRVYAHLGLQGKRFVRLSYKIFVRLRTSTYIVGSNHCGTPCGADRLPGVDAVHRLFGQRTGAAVSESGRLDRLSSILSDPFIGSPPPCSRRSCVITMTLVRHYYDELCSPSRPRLPVAAHAILEGAELLDADRPAGVHAPGGDADLGAEAELAAVGELGGGVVQHDRGIDLFQEALRGRGILADDAIGVMRAIGLDMRDRGLQPSYDADRDDRIEVFGAPVVLGRERDRGFG